MRSKVKQKKLRDQTMVITGASSGIGLTTARMAAERGARVVLTARSEDDLRRITGEIRARGGRATYVVGDVADPAAMDRVAETAEREFGGIDTWVNNAGVAVYGKLTDVPMEDKRQMFETNFWGVVNGCRTAVKHMQHRGGTIINIGSVASDRTIPLISMYSASKHAVLGYTDGLRMELEHDGIPIWVSLVKPGSTNTPFVDNARNYMEAAPYYPPPVYDPEVVASAVLKCAEKRIREITVGGGTRMMAVFGKVAPRTTDRYMEAAMFSQQKDPQRPADSPDGLEGPGSFGRARGPYRGRVMKSSAYTSAMLSDVARLLPAIAAGVVFTAGVRRWLSTEQPSAL
jgi:short-subunit dehydrogenase